MRSGMAVAAETRGYGPQWRGDGRLSPEQYQLEALNRLWPGYIQRIPYYRELHQAGRIPIRFESFEQFSQAVPIIDKTAVRDRCNDLTDPIRPMDRFRVTGGSTGEPTKMPAWKSEYDTTLIDKWVGRAFYGVSPSDRLFTIWGHSHLLGKGLRGRINANLRRLKDHLIGTYRFSAYDLSPAASRRAADIVLSTRPDYIIAYSSALEFFARVNEDRAADFARCGLKLALATGEIFPSEDGPETVAKVLGCPVAMEYGSVETDILAHTHPDKVSPLGPAGRGFRVFWRRYYLECEAPSPDGDCSLLVTSLYPRCFPLVRYRIGDSVNLYPGDPTTSLIRVASVVGRANSFIQLADGTRVHTMGIKHCVEGVHSVGRFQIIQSRPAVSGQSGGIAELRILLAATNPVEAPAMDSIRRQAEQAIREKAAKIHPELGKMRIVFDRPLIQTRAGKTPMIAEDDGHG